MGICIISQINPENILPYLEKLPKTSATGISINPMKTNIGEGRGPQEIDQGKGKSISTSYYAQNNILSNILKILFQFWHYF